MSDQMIRRALIAVYDKTGIVDFARALHDEFAIEIISTGGTAKVLTDAGIPVTLVEQVTGFPEMLDGRVKTLHPKIHAAILADRDNPDHMRQLAEHDIKPIDMVVVNLYPFEKTVADPNCKFEDAIEMIDIGGPCLLRAAAKNHKHVLVVSGDFMSFAPTLDDLRHWDEPVTREGALRCGASGVFSTTAAYDAKVATWLCTSNTGQLGFCAIHLHGYGTLRYGENPHQEASLKHWCEPIGYHDLADAEMGVDQSGWQKRISYNNYVDADAAINLCAELARISATLADERPRGLKPAAHSTQLNEPRASARAAVGTQAPLDSRTPFAPPAPGASTWLLTWTTYGTWLPGDVRGFVGRTPTESGEHRIFNEPDTPYSADQPDLAEAARERMAGKPVYLNQSQAIVAADALSEAAITHDIRLIAISVMANHIHVLCQSLRDGSELLKLLKGVTSRRLGQNFPLTESPRWWTKSGSSRHLRPGDDPTAVINYVCRQQAPLLVRSYETELNDNSQTTVPSHPTAARAEARGSFPTVVFIKHTNACGVSIAGDPIEAYRRAYLGDPNAAMGGILAVNFSVTGEFAEAVMASLDRWGKAAGAGAFFLEVWLAPAFDDEAVKFIRVRKKWGANVRLLSVGDMTAPPDPNELEYKSIAGGMLVQTRDIVGLNEDQWQVVTKRSPTESEMSDLRLAWLVAKHTKSNAISICKDGMLIGNGAGQMSRVMSCRIATWLAKENGHADKLPGSVAASDAFFPFRDGPDLLIDAGITALIQPGGSKRDEETIKACDERGVAMIFTGTRHFKH